MNDAHWNLDNTYARLPGKLHSSMNPVPVEAPEMVILNRPLAESLGLDARALETDDGVAVFAGNRVPEGAKPLAQAYAGHQFGHFTMLGDGRALLLGEQVTPGGERFDIQLKGSGRTPYSRGGDGRAALGPMLREYIISEAMHALGIPTTRSLAVVATGEVVHRESDLPGAILTRVAASHIRVGTFEFAAKWGSAEELRALADYTINRHYPAIADTDADGRYHVFLRAVIGRQASLIAKWMLVGFIHGVMNTDNMTISGETIDYGPCAFMDTYDPATVFSSIDIHGRYAYGNQPPIAAWNLARFAETLLPLLHPERDRAIELAQDAIAGFTDLYHDRWFAGMKAKLGITNDEEDDEALVIDLLDMMQCTGSDYTNTFLALSHGIHEGTALASAEGFDKWHERWQTRLGRQELPGDAAQQLMFDSNPAVIPRNHRVEEALAAAADHGDFEVMHRLLAALSKPYDPTPGHAGEYAAPGDAGRCYRTFCGT